PPPPPTPPRPTPPRSRADPPAQACPDPPAGCPRPPAATVGNGRRERPAPPAAPGPAPPRPARCRAAVGVIRADLRIDSAGRGTAAVCGPEWRGRDFRAGGCVLTWSIRLGPGTYRGYSD